MWGRKESLKLLIPSQSLVSQGTYVCLKLLFDLSETCKREWILEYSWKKNKTHKFVWAYMQSVCLWVCVLISISPHIKLCQYGSTAQAFLQRDHGVPQSMLV